MILVTGATGNVGRELVNILVAQDVPVRALTRDVGSSNLPEEVEVVVADLKEDPTSVRKVLEGVHSIFLNPAAVRDPSELLAHAKDLGVEHIVLLSAMPVRDDLPIEKQPGFIARRHKMLELQIEASGLRWTHVRSNMLMSNAFFEIAPQIRMGNIVRQAYGDANSAPVDERDIAAVVANVLMDPAHRGAVYECTGPESMTEKDKVRVIGQAIGRELEFHELTREEARGILLATFPVQHSNGLAEEHVETVLNYAEQSIGAPARLTDAVERITGKPPRSYADWAASRASKFPAAPVLTASS
ncbi:hypothetical protein DM793_03610 [Paenarthrobacter nitroguajacolicus]|uniref:NmrA family NAD(P)-binding protein n=1 Tax=Paenarthrobacter nitroguajacolicus TaxID=211146 RepID=UPI0015BAFA44|nr:NmrA family NAD(P)-binding protein [Paenarthrobacter nitroguajacolicus]NWL10390.1 hypothetical protein [Paenarthrobacter nitroguajacolicus]